MINKLSARDREFADNFFGGPDEVRGNATACYRHLHPKAKITTCQVEGSKILSKPMVALYLESRRVELTKSTGINAEYVLRQSVRYLEIAFGDRPAPEGFNAMGVKAALELIGKNTGVKAFQDSIEIGHTFKLEQMLNDRIKAIEVAADQRKLELVK
ncbi:MAG: terminase small subunit [Gammaproteobacteria bacterium]|nr:terminase small subunit [Gammaproteobacteria bacterium]